MKNFLLGFIAGTIVLLILVYLFLPKPECGEKEVLQFKEANLDTATKHVQNFYHAYPDSVADTQTGKKYPVSKYFTIYAVKFKLNKQKNDQGYRGSEIEAHYPNVDFKSILEKTPEYADGIRVYEAIDTDKRVVRKPFHERIPGLNYITFTEEIQKGGDCPSNDIFGQVYEVVNHNFDLREFREIRSERKKCTKSPLTSHLSCAPHCPEVSLLTREL